MEIFEQLERIKQRGFIGAVGFMPDGKTGVITTMVGIGKDMDEDPPVQITAEEGETIEQVLYRAIFEFDEKFPE